MVIFSEFHPSAYSGTIDINVICQFCNKPHILPGFTLIPHKSNVIKMDIMDTYFFCRCLIPPDHGDRDISVQHLDIIKIDIINLSFGKLFRISAKQNLNIEQFVTSRTVDGSSNNLWDLMQILSSVERIKQFFTSTSWLLVISIPSPVTILDIIFISSITTWSHAAGTTCQKGPSTAVKPFKSTLLHHLA